MTEKKRKRGFAAMDPARQRQIASMGGKACHEKGTGHEFTTEEAIEAGRKGGLRSHMKGTAHRFTQEEAKAAGKKGAAAKERKRLETPVPLPEGVLPLKKATTEPIPYDAFEGEEE
jgi:general stress protein YciG